MNKGKLKRHSELAKRIAFKHFLSRQIRKQFKEIVNGNHSWANLGLVDVFTKYNYFPGGVIIQENIIYDY